MVSNERNQSGTRVSLIVLALVLPFIELVIQLFVNNRLTLGAGRELRLLDAFSKSLLRL
jgi:hypothetical protein